MAVKKDLTTNKWFYYGKYVNLENEVKQYKKRGFNTKSEAKKEEQLFLTAVNTLFKSMTLNELFDEYLMFSKQHLKISTLYNDQKKYKKIDHIFGNKKIDKITPKQIQIWQQSLFDNGYSVAYIDP